MDEEEERGAVLHEAAASFICPPRLEDAGLEDCALPPESIMEAFALAAISVGPRVDEDGDDEGFQKLRRKLGVPSGFDRAMDEEEERGAVLHEAAASFICPPRLEDAGLEDCALPPESIMEAFALAAISVGPRVDEDGDDEGFGEAPDEDGASGAASAVVGGGGVGVVASDGLAILGGDDSDSVEKKTAKEYEDEEKEEINSR